MDGKPAQETSHDTFLVRKNMWNTHELGDAITFY